MSNSVADIYLSALWHEPGQRRDIAALDGFAGDKGLEQLVSEGLVSFRESDGTASSLARAAMARTLELVDVPPSSLGALVYCTESFDEDCNADGMARACRELGMTSAYPIGLFGASCANLHSAIRIVRALIHDQAIDSALVVCAERLPDGRSRVPDPAMSIISDGAVSFVVTATPHPGFRVLGMAERAVPAALSMLETEGLMAFLNELHDNLRRVTRANLEGIGKSTKDIARLFTNNYTPAIMESFALVTGFDISQLYLDNASSAGHVGSADTIINLAAHMNSAELRVGDLMFLLVTGPHVWGSIILERV
jgi:3-oxoacyl-[acyl-carrier-protein] synthase III